jgi:hypothetical protein
MFKIDLNDIKRNKTFSTKINSKISDVLFSQLLPSITNLLEITNNKAYAVEIICLFQEKYIYFTKESAESLFSIVSKDKEEVQKLRKEYELKKVEKKIKNDSLNKIEANDTMNLSGSELDLNTSKNLTDIIRDKNSIGSDPSLNGEENINYNLILEEDKESNEDDNSNKITSENPDKEDKDIKNNININKIDNINKIEDKESNIFDDYEDIKKEDFNDYYEVKKSSTNFQTLQRKIKQKFLKK